MNFRYEWTVLQGNDELLRRGTRSTHLSRGGQRQRRSCHSLDSLHVGQGRPSDRGMVHPPVPDREMEPQVEAHAQSKSCFGPESSPRHPLTAGRWLA